MYGCRRPHSDRDQRIAPKTSGRSNSEAQSVTCLRTLVWSGQPHEEGSMSNLQQLEKVAAEARTASERDRRRSDESAKIYASYSRLIEPVKHGHSAAVVHVFRKEFRHILDLYSLYSAAEKNAATTVRNFPRLFPPACQTAGIDIDSTSRHPEYTVRGFISISIDAKRLKARITIRDVKPVTISTDIDPLVGYLQIEIKRLFETTRDSIRLLNGLQTAYMALLKEEQKPVGHELPIRRVANRLSKNWTHFRYDEFNVDLGNIVKSGDTLIGSMRLHLNHTRDTKRGMLLYGLEAGGYADHISFKQED